MLPSEAVAPPVTTRAATLPFHELTWKNFERLCVHLALQDADVEHCQLYGEQGQDQEGIDLYSRLKTPDRPFAVFQCKKVKEFGPANLREAVDTFLGGAWVQKATSFTICSATAFTSTQLATALEDLVKSLKERGVSLVPWDAEQLSRRLKGLPELVDDFFGRPWVREFCGPEAEAALSPRLDFSKRE
jgi:hypothetical protein